jgi:hypothetical protein
VEPTPPLGREYEQNIALSIVLSFITLGLYNIYWNSKQFKAMNALLGREEFRFWYWLILSVVTFGLFHIYYEYKMGSELQKWLSEHNYSVSPNLGVLGLVLSCFALTVITDAVYQNELNKLV